MPSLLYLDLMSRLPDVVDRGSLESMLRWLQDNDPNGCYTDACARREGFRPIRRK